MAARATGAGAFRATVSRLPYNRKISFAVAVATGRSVPDAALHAGLSTAGAVAGGSVVGGACEAGTLGLGTPGCLVLGGGAAAVGGFIGNGVADLIDDL